MKKIFFFCIVLMVMTVQTTLAQGVGINATGAAPDNSAMLDIVSPAAPNQVGMLIPRVNLSGGFAATPAPYLTVMNTNPAFVSPANSFYNRGVGMYFRDTVGGTPVWRKFLTSRDSTLFWGLRGNSIATGDFIGTTNNQTFRLRSNNIERMTFPTSFSGSIDFQQVSAMRYVLPSPLTSEINNGDAIYAIGSRQFGLGGNGSTFTNLRFGANGWLAGYSGIGVWISTGDLSVPTERLDVNGNIYSRNKFISSESHTGTQTKTGTVQRYWAGGFSGTTYPDPSGEIFEELGGVVTSSEQIRFRIVRIAADTFALEASRLFNSANTKQFVINNQVVGLSSGTGTFGPYVAVNTFVSGTGNRYEILMTSESLSGPDLDPLYRITVFFNGTSGNSRFLKVLIEAFYPRT